MPSFLVATFTDMYRNATVLYIPVIFSSTMFPIEEFQTFQFQKAHGALFSNTGISHPRHIPGVFSILSMQETTGQSGFSGTEIGTF